MRQVAFKILPLVMGAVLGFLVFNAPPSWYRFGPPSVLTLGVALVAGLVATTAIQLTVSLPRDVEVEPAPEAQPPAAARALLEELGSLGFECWDPPCRIHIRPAGLLWPLRHENGEVVGSVFCTATIPVKVGYELLSLMRGERGALSSGSDPMGASLPLPPGYFKQVLRGASPKELLAFHLQAHRFLIDHGVVFETPPPGTSVERIRRSLRRLHAFVRATPIRSACVALWRTITRSTPYDAPVDQQASTAANLTHLSSSRG